MSALEDRRLTPPPSAQLDSPQKPYASTSHVNGKGLWRSWQRSFRRPLDALLDLLDNAIDANHGKGKIRISASTPHRDDDCLLLLNSYASTAYKEMSKILEVFSSQKEQQAIGENGVGVKQASANLSNFSVVVTKKGTRFQVGILCVSLQRPEGIYIPSYTIEGDWEQECENLCENDKVFSKCMEYLGGKPVPTESESYDMDETNSIFQLSGRDRLLELMSHMSDSKEWKNHECVFGLLLDQLRFRQSVESVLDELTSTLPQTYLHLQAHQCDITIQKAPLKFQYWERRLVELTCFPIRVSRTVNLSACAKDEVANPKRHANQLRIFVGFDPQRSKDESRQSCATLYVYSRECGRLVKHTPDARNELGLNSGGTQFCQGLTVILDDFESSLPLTPTKQDIAWSDGQQGDVHRSNLYCWLRAVTYTYYNHYLAHFLTKGNLNDEVKSHASASESLHDTSDFVTPLSEHLFFNAFSGLIWTRHGTGRIMPKNKSSINVVYGAGTLLPFALTKKEQESQKTTSKSSTKKRSHKEIASPFFAEETPEVGARRNGKRTKTDVSRFDVMTPDTLTSIGDADTSAIATDGRGPTSSDSIVSPGKTPDSREQSVLGEGSGLDQQPSRIKDNVKTEHILSEVATLHRSLQEKEKEIAVLRSEKEALQTRLRQSLPRNEESEDLGSQDDLRKQLEEKEAIIEEMKLSAEQKLSEKDAIIDAMQSKHFNEMKQLKEMTASTLERLRRRNDHLELENQGMKEEINRKNAQLLIMEEELE